MIKKIMSRKSLAFMRAIFFFSLSVIVLLPGCAPKNQSKGVTRVNIAFQEWVGYGPFYLAQEKGFMRQEGIELVFVNEQLDSARRDAFKEGMLDFEAGTIDLLVSKVAQDTPIVAVMEIDQSFGSDAIVADETIKSLEDLSGKRIALARDDVGETFISVLFYQNALPFSAATIVPRLTEEVADSFLNREVDACVTWEPQVSKALQRPGAHVLTSTKEHPGIIIDTLNARKDLVENNPGLVKKLMRGWFKALQYYKEYPLEASGIIARYYGVTPEQYRKQVEGLEWDSYEEQQRSSEKEEWFKAFDSIAEVKLANGRILKKPDASKFLNHTLLEKLYEVSP
ncbi:MAG TPA: ABC transporter substrate-binding protein [Candidatus Omnitrophota bacterium]|nr:ABC transporter substrate-binding protein [Candidatus Omnitrophota bacterium]HPD84738.1 ABC transporter substrate-binding protein [Candidatus Omnitrophota bacterium]HRZ03596.1 ABC transporter substrate-binding protein [Candidatus Omnitrophota bacterium]